MAKKKLLTLDNLYDFYLKQNKTCTFSAKESGYQVSVQIPTKFEISDEIQDDTLLFCTVKLMHSGENRNHSCVTDDALYKAGKNLAYKPILANFMEYVDEATGETLKDFTAHDMEINDDGTVTYLEKQIGCFTADEPYYEVEEETGHNFLYGKCAIPVEYSDAYSIIKRKNGTKVSVELLVNEMQYNAQSKVLELTDVIIQGATCLGKNPETLQDVGEGMLNARLDIADFSVENNSVKFSKDEKLIELLDKLNTTLSNFNDNNFKKGGENQSMTKFEELLAKYNKTAEDITFEYENLSDDELTAKFEEIFGESEENKEDVENPDGTTEDNTVDESTDNSTDDESNGAGTEGTNDNADSDDNTDDTVTENNACGGGGSGSTKKKKKNSVECSYEVDGVTRTFEISLQDKIYAIHDLVNKTYADVDNTYYGVKVYDSYVIMEDWCTGRYFKQSYTDENDVYTLTGDRVEVYAEFVTSEELSELQSMRSNYSSIVEQLNAYKYAEDIADKMTVFDDESYSAYLETEAFKDLMAEENLKKFTKEELIEKADAALGRAVKETKSFSFNFSNEDASGKKKNKIGVFSDFDNAENQNIYGDYFKSVN